MIDNTKTPIFKALAALVVATWDNWDDERFGGDVDPFEHVIALANACGGDKPNCIAQLMYFYQDNPLDLTLCAICELCREYIKA